MAVAPKTQKPKEYSYIWEGKDKTGKQVKGEMRAPGEVSVAAHLRRQGINIVKIKRLRATGKSITEKEHTLFTRQLAVMMKSGVPLLQAFDIVGKGHNNPSVARLLLDIKTEVETGSSLQQAFLQYPLYFDALYCNLIGAGEAAGILDALLERLATYMEKTQALKSKIKSALFYPISIIVVAFIITAVIMIFGGIGGGFYAFFYAWKRSKKMQSVMDRLLLKIPIFGELIRKATIARWTRTLSTMFAAGVPLVESLDSVAGAAGNVVYYEATKTIQREVSTGSSLTSSMQNTEFFPSMVLQMV